MGHIPQPDHFHPSPIGRLLTREQLKLKGISLSNPTLLRLEKAGQFPHRIYLGRKTPAWSEVELDRHLDASRAIPTMTEKALAARHKKVAP